MLNNDGDYWIEYGNDGNVGIRMVSRFIQTVTTFWSLRAEWLVNQGITIHIFNECVGLTVLVSIFFMFVYIPWMFVNPIYSVFLLVLTQHWIVVFSSNEPKWWGGWHHLPHQTSMFWNDAAMRYCDRGRNIMRSSMCNTETSCFNGEHIGKLNNYII
jgi:hypothetical protein